MGSLVGCVLGVLLYSATTLGWERSNSWRIGGGEGPGEEAAELAILLLQKLDPVSLSKLNIFKATKHCLGVAPDSHQCVDKLLLSLPTYFSSNVVELGVPVDATIQFSHWKRSGRSVLYLGDIAPPARRSCMVTNLSSKEIVSNVDLANSDIATKYSLSSDEEAYVLSQQVASNVRINWTCDNCTNGTYTPNWCSEGTQCGDLLVGDAGEAQVAVKLVERWRWRVRVRALGPNLEPIVLKYAARPLLLCAWAPQHTSIGNALANSTPLTLPPCPELEPRRLIKIAKALHIKRNIRTLLERMSLTTEQFRELNVLGAKKWLESNEHIVEPWKQGYTPQPSVQAAIPYSGDGFAYDGKGLEYAALLAKEHTNFQVGMKDSACNTNRGVQMLADIYSTSEYDTLAAVIGPACGDAWRAVAAQTNIYRLPLLAYTATTAMEERAGPRLQVLAAGDARDLASAIAALLAEMKWQAVSVLSESSARSFVDASRLGAGLILPDNYNVTDYNTIQQWAMERSSQASRILAVGVEDSRVARSVLCAGKEAGLTPRAGVVWLLPATLPHNWLQPDKSDPHHCTYEELVQMAQYHLSFGGSWMETATEPHAASWLMEWRKLCGEDCVQNKVMPPPHAALLYDTLRLVAAGINTTLAHTPGALANLHESKIIMLFMQNLMNSSYTGLTGPFVFRSDFSRVVTINVYQWKKETRRLVGRYHPENNTLNMCEELEWGTPDSSKPTDVIIEYCRLQGLANLLGSSCQTAIIVLWGSVCLIAISALVIVLVVWIRRVERTYKDRLQKASSGKVLALQNKKADFKSWEVPRDCVVLTRKLGFGAFGAVYGGHAVLGKNQSWSAVAVKTLKPGATTEDKLDFLSEAETMKRFNHKNVVKLLGVVTATEPLYSVMELLLYGDLKCFLLARRHLAAGTEGAGAEAEVSPRRLTGWALDAARGLSYLATLRYVHRDVAARNCLLSAQRVLKLADFGMTRLIFENDYYRFSRKGMLPVRWMAPESLCVGVFSAASDVWSLGVLMYEIITFGALPFQGLSNSEVVAKVKSGHTTILPSGLKPQLKGLIKSCWQQDRRKRPLAADVVVLLAECPRLLTPCLDMPFDELSFDIDPQWQLPSNFTEIRLRSGRPRLNSMDFAANTTSAATDTTSLSGDTSDGEL